MSGLKAFTHRMTLSNGGTFVLSWVEPLTLEDAEEVMELIGVATRRLHDGRYESAPPPAVEPKEKTLAVQE